MTENLTKRIISQIKDKNRGWCFTAHDFHEFGNYQAIRRALARLTQVGMINRLAEGLYYYPHYHDELGELPVSIEAIIDAMQRAHQIRCQPSGAYAANLLGLSEQVPAKVTLLTDGASKKMKIGNREIQFKKTTPKIMANAGTITGLVIQAIKHIGKDHITSDHLQRLKNRLSNGDIITLKKNAFLAPAWIAKLIRIELIGE